jgi:aspartyl/asparaginyl-tRNA synthetase
MKHLRTFENYVLEFFDFDKVFDIDEDVLSYVFSEILDKYPTIQIKLEEIDNKNFKIEIFDTDKKDLSEVYNFLKKNDIYIQIKAHFDVMDFKIKEFDYKKSENKIVFVINQLVSQNESYNKPRSDMKSRWSVKYKKSIDCSNAKGFSQIQYCKRKKRGGKYKSEN